VKWSPISTAPEGVLVLTKIEDKWGQRNVQKLVRREDVWYRQSNGGKVYYLPTHWWEVTDSAGRLKRPRKSAKRGQIGKLRKQLVDTQRGRCGICGGPMADYDPRPGAPFESSVEHVVPRKRGGGISGNVFASHKRCNTAKADRPPTGCELVFLAWVNARLANAPDPPLPARRITRD
jgi:5-methylcytosine-specific restriction endonuclease McrA